MPRVFHLSAVLLALVASGCGGRGTSGPAAGPTDKDAAADVARMLKDFQEANNRPPAGLRDLVDADATHPLGYGAVSNQQFVVLWKVPVSGDANAVLAYHCDVPAKGGPVVMQDGKVREMTPAEFQAARKGR